MRYVTVEIAVDSDDDRLAENVVIEGLDHVKEGRRGELLGNELLGNFQVVAIAEDWSDEAKLFGAHRG